LLILQKAKNLVYLESYILTKMFVKYQFLTVVSYKNIVAHMPQTPTVPTTSPVFVHNIYSRTIK